MSCILRENVSALDLKIMSEPDIASKSYITIQIPESESSLILGEFLESQGISVNYRSYYLSEKNLIQLGLLGLKQKEEVLTFVSALKYFYSASH